MASTTSRTYRLPAGVTVESLGQAVIGFLQNEKGMVAEGAPTPEGFFVQAKSDDDTWKKVAGMTKATQVQIIGMGDMATVNIGQGKWSDKVGAGIVGAVLFAPLAVTAIVGSVSQSKLPGEILAYCERFLMSGGVSVSVGSTQIRAGQTICKCCGAYNPDGTRFCSSCGNPMAQVCPQCGNTVADGMRFCPHCGSNVAPAVPTCTGCGNELQPGQAFCPTCGTKAGA